MTEGLAINTSSASAAPSATAAMFRDTRKPLWRVADADDGIAEDVRINGT